MIIKVTYPIQIGNRLVQPGESIDVAPAEAEQYIANEWAVATVAVAIDETPKKRKVKEWLPVEQ